MNLTRAAIQKNRITLVSLTIIAMAGLGAYRGMTRAEDPGFVIRAALVLTYLPGAAPQRVELLVTDKIEKVIQEIPELDFVTSQSRMGVSVIYANIKESYKDMRPIWDDLRRKVADAQPELPEGTIGPFVNDELGDVFGTIIAITGEGFSYAELKDVADQVRDELLRIDDVAKVEIHGAQDERIFVEYKNARLAELGLSPTQLQAILEARNIIIPGGSVNAGVERIGLEPSGNFESVSDLQRSVINLPGRQEVIYLQDIATVRRGYVDPPESIAYSSGERALALAVSMRDGGNLIRLGDEVTAVVGDLQTQYPIGIEFDIVFSARSAVVRLEDHERFVGNRVGRIAIVIGVFESHEYIAEVRVDAGDHGCPLSCLIGE